MQFTQEQIDSCLAITQPDARYNVIWAIKEIIDDRYDEAGWAVMVVMKFYKVKRAKLAKINTCISMFDMQVHLITILTKYLETILSGDPDLRAFNEILDYLEELCRIKQNTEHTSTSTS